MRNVNINLTTEQAILVEEAAKKRGFANRSEFFRALLRYVFLYSPEVLKKLDSFVFEEPSTHDVNQIVTDLAASGKYNKKFLKSLERGLQKSEYFQK